MVFKHDVTCPPEPWPEKRRLWSVEEFQTVDSRIFCRINPEVLLPANCLFSTFLRTEPGAPGLPKTLRGGGARWGEMITQFQESKKVLKLPTI